ncbi:hypothetical protein FV241_21485 [Methylobacterium sp. WL2]|nr:hypothetical protein FVA80_22260 [Methylobacterium sp. WL1]TXN43832.1 hypothetical protein FV233_17000 [Methylobacterium sp. WL7]TXN55037.1 hypothetical protein FV241_21485 [Methylobacterium sp. WL2]
MALKVSAFGQILRSHRVKVVPCTAQPGCFRWIITSADGQRSEQSSYSYATVAGARAVGNMRLRELVAKT